MIAAVLFDLDGTLLDTRALIVASFQHVARVALGRAVDPARDIYPTFGEPLRATLGRWAPGREEELVALYRKYNLAHHDELVRSFPGAREVLDALAGTGRGIAVVTSKLHSSALRGLQRCGLADRVAHIVGLDDCPQTKPSPVPLQLALRRLRVEPAAAVMVGDSPADMQAAVAAGVRPLGVAWSVFPAETLKAAGAAGVLEEMPSVLDYLA